MQPTNFEVNHFEPYPGDEKKGGTSRSPKVWNFTATYKWRYSYYKHTMNQICWAIALRLLVATKKQKFRCRPQLLEMYCQNWDFFLALYLNASCRVYTSIGVGQGKSLRTVLSWGQLLSLFGDENGHFGTKNRVPRCSKYRCLQMVSLFGYG